MQFGLKGRGPSFARGKATYRTAIVLEELLEALSGLAPRPLLVVRLHPKNARGEFAAYESEVDAFSAGGDPLPLVFAADLVVGIATALLEEAHIMGRPALSILPREEERDWLEALRDGRITSVTARSELRPALVRALHDRSDRAAKHTCVEDARARTVRWISRQLLAEPVHG
jgi:predicted glycosyltransferase